MFSAHWPRSKAIDSRSHASSASGVTSATAAAAPATCPANGPTAASCVRCSRSVQTTKCQRWRFFELGARRPAWRIRSSTSGSSGRPWNDRQARNLETASPTFTLLEDLGRAVAALEPPLVRSRRPARPVVEVDEEVGIDLHAAVRAAVHLEEPRAQTRVELVVPSGVERVRDVEAAPVERELQHLRSAVQLPSSIAVAPEQAAEPELPGELRVGRIRDVVLAEVAVQPVGEVEEAVVHRQDEIGDQPGQRERPALQLDTVDGEHLLRAPAAVPAVEAPHRARQRGADEALLGVRIVEPPHLERNQTAVAEVDRLLE